jgi:hypothetical protein
VRKRLTFLLLAAGAFGTLGMLTGCAAESARHAQDDLKQLQQSLPGTYESRASNEQWTIVPEQALAIGDAVYFVRQNALDNPRLLLAQRVWTFSVDATGRIIQRIWLFRDARRWARAGQDPDMLLSVLPQDLQALEGCDLTWQRTAASFHAMGDDSCHPAAAQGLWIERAADLAGASLILTERHAGPDGELDLSGHPLSVTLTRTSSSHP